LRIIGLTGQYCAGKNAYANLFLAKGYPMVEVDTLGHEALSAAKEEIVAAFGKEVLTVDGTIDRKRLGSIVFADSHKLAVLESITHPRMVAACVRMLDQWEKEGCQAAILNAALLHRMKLDVLCDYICFIEAPLCTRYKRAVARDHATLKGFTQKLRAQRDIRRKAIIGTDAVFIMKNSGDMSLIHRQVEGFCVTIGL